MVKVSRRRVLGRWSHRHERSTPWSSASVRRRRSTHIAARIGDEEIWHV